MLRLSLNKTIGHLLAGAALLLGASSARAETFPNKPVHILKAALQDRDVRVTLDKIGATPVGSTPSEFDAFMHAEVTKWEPVLKAANIRAQ
jgi:hypothetical protein